MIDPGEFKAPFITIEDIRRTVAIFRSRYWPHDTIPVDIFEIVEFELDIEIRTIVRDSSGDSTRQFVAHGIAKYFEVSDQVIEKD